jgi:hypothetical protein
MGTVIAIAVGAVLVASAFWLGHARNDRRLAFLPAILPAALLVWAAITHFTEDKSDCMHGCASAWLILYSVVAVVPAAVLAAAVVLGATVRRRAADAPRRGRARSATPPGARA